MKLYTLPDEISLKEGYSIRRTYKKDAKQLRNLINNYLSKFEIRAKFTKREIEHWFTFREGRRLICGIFEFEYNLNDYFSMIYF